MKSMQNTKLASILALTFLCFGCHGESSIDNVPVSDIEISQPPIVTPPVKSEPVHGDDGIFKVSDQRYYNAVVPFGFVELECSDRECRFYVPKMNRNDVEGFLDKYFPYQVHGEFNNIDTFEVFAAIKPEFQDDSIIPALDMNVTKPTPETAVEISVFINKRENRYEWIYRDPMNRVRDAEIDAEVLAKEKIRDEEIAAARQEKPSDDSEGMMVNANYYNAK